MYKMELKKRGSGTSLYISSVNRSLTRLLEILYSTDQLEILLKRGDNEPDSITSRDPSAVLFSKDL